MADVQGPEAKTIKNLFGNIAGTYDKANDVITFGMARQWRKQLVKMSQVLPGMKVLDCATGTGDLAIDFKKSVGQLGQVIGTDFSPEMLSFAPGKAKKLDLDIEFQLEDVTDLSFENDIFNVTSIAYGIRNVNDPKKAIREMARVTQTNGKVMILETGTITTPVFKTLIPLYFNHIVPRLGGYVSGNKDAYNYLNKSSGKFPCRDEFVAIMESTGCFSSVTYKSILGGASYIYKAIVK